MPVPRLGVLKRLHTVLQILVLAGGALFGLVEDEELMADYQVIHDIWYKREV